MNVSTLSPEGEALVRAGRAAFRPGAADRERVLEALRARLGSAAGGASGAGADGPPPVPAAAGGAGWPLISAAVAGVAIGAGALWFAFGHRAPEPPAPSPTPVVVAAPKPGASTGLPTAEAEPAARPEEDALPPAPEPAPAANRARAPRDARDRLAKEVAILSRAETDLHAGRFASALRTLREHEREFPRGTLTQERVAAQAQALCGLGRMKEAESMLRRLAPGSLQEGRAREACRVRSAK